MASTTDHGGAAATSPGLPSSIGRRLLGGLRLPSDRDARLRWGLGAALVVVGLVLRWWDLGGPALTFDEAFTAVYSRQGVGDLLPSLRDNDSHPPLDYLIRHFTADQGAFWLRAPSAVLSSLTLLLVAWWMRGRGWFGILVLGFTSVSAFQLLYAHQARMYAAGILCGTLAAVAADRWHGGDQRTRWAVVAGVSVALGLLSMVAFGLLVPFLLLIAGRDRSRAAWIWRFGVVAGVGAWAVTWGPYFVTQAQTPRATWIPYTDLAGIAGTVNGFASLYGATQVLVVGLVGGGGYLLWRSRNRLRVPWILLAAGPFVITCLVGLQVHFLLTRTLASAAWAVPVAFAAVVDAVRRRSAVLGLGLAMAIAIVLAASTYNALRYDEDSTPARELLSSSVQPGDAVVVYPRFLWPLATWDLDTAAGFDRTDSRPLELTGVEGYAATVGPGPFTGRVWLLMPESYGFTEGDLVPCAEQPPPPAGDFLVRCFEHPVR